MCNGVSKSSRTGGMVEVWKCKSVEVLEFGNIDWFAIDAWFEKNGSRGRPSLYRFSSYTKTHSAYWYTLMFDHHKHTTHTTPAKRFLPTISPLFSSPYTFLSLASRPFFLFFFTHTHSHTHTHTHTHKMINLYYPLSPLSTESPDPPGSLGPDDASINWLGAAGMGSRADDIMQTLGPPPLF